MKKDSKRMNGIPSTGRLGGDLVSSQIARKLMEEISQGRYQSASLLPSEIELSAELGVSRTAVRDALSELERKGYIERVRGIGTVINHGVAQLERRMDQKFEFYQMIEALGHQPHSDHLMVTRQEANADTAAALGIAEGQTVLVICKRVLADSQPVVFSTDTLPLSLFGEQNLKSIDFSQPIFTILQKYCEVQTSSVTTHIRPAYGGPAVRRLLALSREQTLLELDELCYSRLCEPVVHCRTYYTDFFDFALVRKLM